VARPRLPFAAIRQVTDARADEAIPGKFVGLVANACLTLSSLGRYKDASSPSASRRQPDI
jgi:hypothetical protein